MPTSIMRCERDITSSACLTSSGLHDASLHRPGLVKAAGYEYASNSTDINSAVTSFSHQHRSMRSQAMYLLMHTSCAARELLSLARDNLDHHFSGGGAIRLGDCASSGLLDRLDVLALAIRDSRLSDNAIVGLRTYLMSLPGDGRWIDDSDVLVDHHAFLDHARVARYIHQHFYHLDDYKLISGAVAL